MLTPQIREVILDIQVLSVQVLNLKDMEWRSIKVSKNMRIMLNSVMTLKFSTFLKGSLIHAFGIFEIAEEYSHTLDEMFSYIMFNEIITILGFNLIF